MAAGKPPTTNLLPASERRRLLRQIGKLGAITGATPVIEDELHLLPAMEIILPVLAKRSSKREGMVMPSRSSDGDVSSLDSELGKKLEKEPEDDMERRRPIAKLCLAPEARNSIADATRLRLVLTLTQPPTHAPVASSSSAPDPLHTLCDDDDSHSILHHSLSILISSTPADEDHAARRRKMVKLSHVLGGPIPSKLVSISPVDERSRSRAQERERSTPSRASRRRSRSVPPPSAYSLPSADSSHVHAPPNKLHRRPPQKPLPVLTVDLISRPRPLIPASSHRELRPRNSAVSALSKTSAARSYGLRRRARDNMSSESSRY
ncbi:hypothetical protein HMN09_00178400 [Mycena chlorophos]|uniref:Uncharacterized protein n=1 Tax=Mycena chlorophos TaxID=658473 RepID=A0A8H6TQD1_MYCCL|nr:hypothetical protein HMN09_00178400 [Mycena chlorophos]